MKSARIISERRVLTAAAILFLLPVYACEEGERKDKEVVNSLSVSVTEPVERDYTEIRNSGVLRMITQYSSNTYFLHQGMEVGFEYELLKNFAREHDLALEVVIVGPDQNSYDLLNSGEGDVIAANYTITPERKQIVNFTRPYNLVNQVIVFSETIEEKPQTLEDLSGSGIPISVRRNSSYYVRLTELNDHGYDLDIHVVPGDLDTETLLFQVANGTIPAIVSDDNMFNAASRYMPGLVEGPGIAEKDSIAWAIRNNAPDLETELNSYLHNHFQFTAEREEPKRSAFLNILRKRYFESGPHIEEYYNPDWNFTNSGLVSPYDNIVQQVADSLDLDWLMLTAMIAQESRFNPDAQSWVGAVGLMQILPQFSLVEEEKLYIPETNIREGARIIKEHLDHYSYMDSLNQWSFALATYNMGVGHMADARRIVIDQNRDPNQWPNVEEALLKLMQSRYYQNARYGFARGIETVQYVKEIMNRYQMYQRVVAVVEQRTGNEISSAGVINRLP